MALDFKPRIAVLFHGSEAQYQGFKRKAQTAMPSAEVIIPETMNVYTVKLS